MRRCSATVSETAITRSACAITALRRRAGRTPGIVHAMTGDHEPAAGHLGGLLRQPGGIRHARMDDRDAMAADRAHQPAKIGPAGKGAGVVEGNDHVGGTAALQIDDQRPAARGDHRPAAGGRPRQPPYRPPPAPGPFGIMSGRTCSTPSRADTAPRDHRMGRPSSERPCSVRDGFRPPIILGLVP